MRANHRSLRIFLARPEIPLVVAAAAVLSCATSAFAEGIRYKVVPRVTVEARLGRYGGKDRQREETLKAMFTEAGCGGQLSEQAVKGSKLPNVVCRLPGSTGQAILVGAHYDHVSEGGRSSRQLEWGVAVAVVV